MTTKEVSDLFLTVGSSHMHFNSLFVTPYNLVNYPDDDCDRG